MTRDDEIVNRSIDYGQSTPSEYDDGRYDLSDLEWAFEEGAKWADKTMIEKACDLYRDELIQFNNLLSHLNSDYDGLVDIEKSIKCFKKAIEE